MSHPTDDQLTLHAFGELAEGDGTALNEHLAACQSCRGRFAGIEESRAGLDWGLASSSAKTEASGRRRLAWLALPLAAGLGAFLLWRSSSTASQGGERGRQPWQSHVAGSATAGYVTGGNDFVSIDAQLTRLEQEKLP